MTRFLFLQIVLSTGTYNDFNVSLNTLEFIFSSFHEHLQSTNYVLDTPQRIGENKEEKAWLCFIYPCDEGIGCGGKLQGKPN